jgi:predicted metalloendopeptidase
MRISGFAVAAVLFFGVSGIVRAHSQTANADAAPKLEHFDLTLIDKSLDPCQDFYQYACSKWIAANPIPADQASWGTESGLQYWNENILREAMQKAAEPASNRTGYEQEVGDYWAACMDESGVEAAGSRDLKPELERIAGMKNKSQLADQVASHDHSRGMAGRRQPDSRGASWFRLAAGF